MSIFTKLFGGDPAENFHKKHQLLLQEINDLEPEIQKLSDISLREKSLELKTKISSSEDLKQALENNLTTAFALIREASSRTLKQRHYDMQLLGGLALHQGKISEMKTGEGKTLAATAPAYLNALSGRGVHIVTVNDYLAKRDAVWMGQIYYALGLQVGCIAHDSAFVYDPDYKNDNQDEKRDEIGGFKIFESYLRPVSRKQAYEADITYGTNHEYGFDYLRDNLIYNLKDRVQRGHYFTIVDEVDSILIDEARTPLIITIPETESSEYYKLFSKISPQLQKEIDFDLDEKFRSVTLNDEGIKKVEKILGLENLYNQTGFRYLHYLEESLKAQFLFTKDKDYVVKDGEILIVDEFTGRLLQGRRYSGGLHQAIEAKENVRVQQENRILASITFQNYFRLYEKISGMTGTALTSSEELDKVYGLEVVPIPTNKPMIRKDLSDLIYKTSKEKWRAIIHEVKEKHQAGQPILIGTISIEKNEYLSALLNQEGIQHEILNAKNHEREGAIIAQAGKLGAITVATNMAGRGVDIVLGGNPPDTQEAEKVKELGGLLVIGTERHDARRIDNQLRGRSGRQGDPGASQFYVSLEDDLMRIFGGEKLKNLMTSLNYPADTPIQAGMISKSIESAQSRVEGFNFDARKHTLEYDDVLNKHRGLFYKRREEVLVDCDSNKIAKKSLEIIHGVAEKIYSTNQDGWPEILVTLGILEKDFDKSSISDADQFNFILEKIDLAFEKVRSNFNQEEFNQGVKALIIKILDTLWTEHLENMEYLRESVRIRAYGQHDPLVEYKKGGHQLFQDFFSRFEAIFFESIFKVQKPETDMTNQLPQQVIKINGVDGNKKVGRNDPCPCGAKHSDGRPMKYKHCCGKG